MLFLLWGESWTLKPALIRKALPVWKFVPACFAVQSAASWICFMSPRRHFVRILLIYHYCKTIHHLRQPIASSAPFHWTLKQNRNYTVSAVMQAAVSWLSPLDHGQY